jgi:quercetin dioxygenase-like cupin family protein
MDDPVGRQSYEFRSAQEDGVEVVYAEGWVDPGGDVPPHIHPNQEERFEILDGELTFTVGRGKQVVRAGESVTVPPGTRHAFRNRTGSRVRMRVRAEPALDLQEFLETTAALGRDGYVGRLGPLRFPRRPAGVVKVALMLRRHRENTLILMPPPLVQRLLFDPLAKRAERRG